MFRSKLTELIGKSLADISAKETLSIAKIDPNDCEVAYPIFISNIEDSSDSSEFAWLVCEDMAAALQRDIEKAGLHPELSVALLRELNRSCEYTAMHIWDKWRGSHFRLEESMKVFQQLVQDWNQAIEDWIDTQTS